MKSWKASLQLIAHYPGWYAASVTVWTMAFFVTIGTGLVIRALLDRLTAGSTDLSAVWIWVVLILAIRLGRSTLDWPAAFIFANHLVRIRTLVCGNLMDGYFRKLGKEVSAGEQGGVGDTLNRLRDDVEPLAALAADDGVDALGRGVRLVVMIGILLAVSPTVTIAVLPALIGCAILAQILSAKLVRYREASRQSTGEMSDFLNEMLHGVQAVKLACAEDAAARQFQAHCETRRNATLRDVLASEAVNKGLDGLTQVAGGVVLLIAAPALTSGHFTIGDLALFITYLNPLADSISFFTHLLVVYRQADVSMERLVPLMPKGETAAIVAKTPIHLDGSPVPVRPKGRGAQDRLSTFLVRGLTCRHQGSDRGVEDVNLTLSSGTLTVVTGRIGSGKSTLLRAILGLLPLEQGELYWNGQPIIDRGDFFQPPRCAYVPQSPVLLSDTLRANILLGRPEEEGGLEQALYLSVMQEDVATLAHGLETVIGPKGMKLSGGQQQRTAAARALVYLPDLLVLDDLSSALDVETERLLWSRLLDELPGDRRPTLLVASHRRGLLQRADQIVVLKAGQVEAAGTLEQVLEKSQEMRELWQERARVDDGPGAW